MIEMEDTESGEREPLPSSSKMDKGGAGTRETELEKQKARNMEALAEAKRKLLAHLRSENEEKRALLNRGDVWKAKAIVRSEQVQEVLGLLRSEVRAPGSVSVCAIEKLIDKFDDREEAVVKAVEENSRLREEADKAADEAEMREVAGDDKAALKARLKNEDVE